MRIDWVRSIPGGEQCVLCIHGILSDHRTFMEMMSAFDQSEKLADFSIGYFEYDFHQSVKDSAAQLAARLAEMDGKKIYLVGHSMGGLVARALVLFHGSTLSSANHIRIKRVIMLGTPNFGVFQPARLSLAAQLTWAATNTLWGTFSRKPGIRDLANVTNLFNEFINEDEDRMGNARHVEYIAIPGLFYHQARSTAQLAQGGATNLALNVVTVLSEVLSECSGFRVELKRPHDGIVEATNVRFHGELSPPPSEKAASIEDPDEFWPPTYAYIPHRYCHELTHVMLTSDPSVIRLVIDLLATNSIADWRSGLGEARTLFHGLFIPKRTAGGLPPGIE